MSERVERALSKSMQESRMPPRECLCTVINEEGRVDDMRIYARDFAELYYIAIEVKGVRKVINYVVIY